MGTLTTRPAMPPSTAELPDTTAPELLRLVEQLWSHEGVRVVTGVDPPAGHRVVERYLVAPTFARARMLLPADSRRARAKALSQYNRLRRGKVRAGRAVLAAGARSGLDRAALRDTVSICVPNATTPDRFAELLPVQHLVDVLGQGPLHAAIGVANPSPNRKPTLQLFRSDGAAAAFAKVGWNDLTRAMVENETAALDLLSDSGLNLPRRPRRAVMTGWHDVLLAATEPMPLGLRGQRSDQCPPLDLSRLRRADRSDPQPFSTTPFWLRVNERAHSVAGAGQVGAAEAEVVAAAIRTVEQRCAGIATSNQPWHGDWVHWNMATYAGELWVWDWEHFSDDAPQTFDAMHFWFQNEFVISGRSIAESLDRATRMTADERARCHHPDLAEQVPTAFALETYLRAAWMRSLGAEWEERLHEPLVRWLAART
jgi:hypothetical protein